jgi:uncharacterized repeat protein (TIGR03803 family)
VPRGDGTAFKVSPDGTETILHNFGAFSTDGVEPVGGMVMDAKGNLYGTTYIGGIHTTNDYGSTAPGTIFRLTPLGEETILHDFANDSTDGGNPSGPLIMDQNGNVYGTTQSGGTSVLTGGGTVFEITAAGEYRILHSFAGPPNDGDTPFEGLTLDSQGNLYGATYGGGSGGGYGKGTVFKLTPGSNGTWSETILYNFSDKTGACQDPFSNVVFDASGNLYGTTSSGGTLGLGCVYELSPAGKFTVLHSFGEGADGAYPTGNVVFSQGSVYGTTIEGGIVYDYAGQGTVFKVTP